MKKATILFLPVLLLLIFACSETQPAGPVNSPLYAEEFRPQFHFSPPANWMNDPNGMVYWDGEYHLFYQYYPDSTVWGPMHWGHAVSTDLVHWENLPIALEPDEHGYIFSGSAVIDHDNTSGLGRDGQPAMVAIYTYHDPEGEKEGRDDFQTQGIAFSTDRGRTWTKYDSNPVLKSPGIKDFRDPKVTWIGEKESGRWLMSLAVKDKISFYSSPNLLDWNFESDFNPEWAAYGGVWECPDLFPLTTKDGEEKWVLLVSINPGGPNGGSATQYFVGDFDGKTFHSESDQVKWLDHGADNYAGVTWSNVPDADGRKLFIGWMSNWLYAQEVPTVEWRSAMTVPRSLELIKRAGTFWVASRPVEELEILRGEKVTLTGMDISLDEALVDVVLFPAKQDFRVEFSNGKGEVFWFAKQGDQITVDRSQSGIVDFQEDFARIHTAPTDGLDIKEVRILLDLSSIEICFNDGDLVITETIFPTTPYSRIKIEGFQAENELYYLKSIW